LKSIEARIETQKKSVLTGTYMEEQMGTKNYVSQNSSLIKPNPKAPYMYPIDFAAATGNLKIAGLIINK